MAPPCRVGSRLVKGSLSVPIIATLCTGEARSQGSRLWVQSGSVPDVRDGSATNMSGIMEVAKWLCRMLLVGI